MSQIPDATNKQQSSNAFENETVGIFLYRFAWGIEICAVLIGLAIGAFQGILASHEITENTGGELGADGYLNIFLAVTPFVMVAIVEATKIPFVGAFYKVRQRFWKMIFGFCILFLALITFETAFTGFERYFNTLLISVSELRKDFFKVGNEIKTHKNDVTDLSILTEESIRSRYNDIEDELSSNKRDRIKAIQERIKTIKSTKKNKYVANLENQIASLKKELARIKDNTDQQLLEINKRFNKERQEQLSELKNQRRSLQNQLASERKTLTNLIENREKAVDQAFIFMKGWTKADYEEELRSQRNIIESIRIKLNYINKQDTTSKSRQEQYRTERNDVTEQYTLSATAIEKKMNGIREELNKSIGTEQKDINSAADRLNRDIDSINLQYKEDKKSYLENLNLELITFHNNQSRILKIKEIIAKKAKLKDSLEDKINRKIGDRQVYRFAVYFYNKTSSATVEPEQAFTIFCIWYGTLSALIALMGIMLAFASYVILDPENRKEALNKTRRTRQKAIEIRPKGAFSKFFDSIRRYLIYKRKIQREPRIKEVVTEIIREIPREIIKEVPVNKVVIVEKPVEIIKKEIIHVPLYTNNKEHINTQQNGSSE